MTYAAVIASMHSFVTMPQASTKVAVSRTGTMVSNVGIIRANRTRMAMSSARTYEIRGCNRALIMASNTIRFSRSEANNKKPNSLRPFPVTTNGRELGKNAEEMEQDFA